MTFQPAIAIAAFDRPASLARLLGSLRASRHQGRPTLIISIEGGAPQDTVDVAHRGAADLTRFETIVRRQPQRLGLRNHILSLGDLSEQYGAVIVLEDDLLVDPYFYEFGKECLDFYSDDQIMAGHALYGPGYNEYAWLPFEAMANGHDTYLMQVPCSWGQCWSANQWKRFRNWLEQPKSIEISHDVRLPEELRRWSDKSWKKHFAHYLVDTERVFSYPYQSLTTNCSAIGGTHMVKPDHRFQASLADPEREQRDWTFCPADNPRIAYDAYMEPVGQFVWDALGRVSSEVEVDLYGTKPAKLLTRKPLTLTIRPSNQPMARYPLQMRPIEVNLLDPAVDQSVASFVLTSSGSVRAEQPYLDLPVMRFRTNMAPLTRKAVRQIAASFFNKPLK